MRAYEESPNSTVSVRCCNLQIASYALSVISLRLIFAVQEQSNKGSIQGAERGGVAAVRGPIKFKVGGDEDILLGPNIDSELGQKRVSNAQILRCNISSHRQKMLKSGNGAEGCR